jgi:anti-sigma-K factor RskA
MSAAPSIDRFEELEAGRILGDLSPEEWNEWQELAESHGENRDGSLEIAAAAIEADFATSTSESLPPELEKVIRKDIAQFVVEPDAENIIRRDFTPRGSRQAIFAWAVAAVLALLLVAVTLTRPEVSETPTVAQALESLRQSTPDLVETRFSGLGDYEPMNGEVVWSDARQEGYMVLTNLPVNNPADKQYQLWIVDPTRDEAPVDGGVFDIPGGQATAIIPIDAKLAIKEPQAFVITLEQPGGVVKSKQETVVALAKAS